VCRHHAYVYATLIVFFFNDTATTEIYTEKIVGSVRCVEEAATGTTAAMTRGDASQYVLRELQIDKAHEIATGKDVLVAMIDSEIDSKHPDLGGTVSKSFDALGSTEGLHGHGTAIAGIIAGHARLTGAAHLFDPETQKAIG